MGIKISSSRKKDLAQDIAAYNAKIARLAKVTPENIPYLPEKIVAKQFINSFNSKEELNAAMRDIRKFAESRGFWIVEFNGIKVSDYAKELLQSKIAKVNKERAIERKKLGMEIQPGTMGKLQNVSLLPKKIPSKFKSVGEFDAFLRSVAKQSVSGYSAAKNEAYKRNIIEAIRNMLPSYAPAIIRIIEGMSASDVVMKFYPNTVITFSFVYSANYEEDKALSLFEELDKEGYVTPETCPEYQSLIDNAYPDEDI